MNQTTVFTRFITLAFLSVLSAGAVAGQPGQAAKTSEDSAVLQSLLSEVRLLRKTMQRTGLNAYRSQIIVERIRVSNEQVERLTQKLDQTRNDMEKTERTIPRFEEQSKVMEIAIQQETDIAKRARLEFEYKEQKRAIEHYKLMLTREREREQQLAAELKTNQTRLGELEGRLDLLEREIENEIERLRSESKPD